MLIRCLLFPLIVLLLSCGKGNGDAIHSDDLLNQWSIEDSTSGMPDSLLILPENQFKAFQNEKSFSGTWELTQGNTLELTYPSLVTSGQVDSTVFVQRENELYFYKDGKVLKSLTDAGVSTHSETIAYTVLHLEDDQLIVAYGNQKVLYQRVRLEQPAASISFLSIARGLLGMVSLVFIAFLFSNNRKAIDWKLVIKGLIFQVVFAVGVLKVPFIEQFFEAISGFFVTVISFTQSGTDFLLRSFISDEVDSALLNFIFQVLPTIIFFSALTSMFYYLGVLQKFVYGFAWLMRKLMRLSGAESLAAAGNIFLGQTESPLLVRPYLDKMTKSEMMCLMSGGMATIAGGVLAAYIGFLGGDDPVQQLYFAKHLLAASVMSAPAAIVAAKIIIPETESFNKEMKIPRERLGTNILEAIANGTTDGIKLAVNVAGMLLVFIALTAMLNFVMDDMIGEWTGLNGVIAEHTAYSGLTLQFVIGYCFAPVAWLMGVHADDVLLVGQLLGEKTILNEFYAYITLGKMKAGGMFADEKSIIMATYILCGFANISSIGIQIGGIGALVPNRKGLLSKLGFRALIAGTLACLFTAVIVGMLY